MAEIELGARPDRLTVPLYPGVDYFSELVVTPPMTGGEAAALVFADGSQWDAVLTQGTYEGTAATFVAFYADAGEVALVLGAEDRSVTLLYTDPDGRPIPWAVGQVVRGKAV